jgi:hypothetical protein
LPAGEPSPREKLAPEVNPRHEQVSLPVHSTYHPTSIIFAIVRSNRTPYHNQLRVAGNVLADTAPFLNQNTARKKAITVKLVKNIREPENKTYWYCEPESEILKTIDLIIC